MSNVTTTSSMFSSAELYNNNGQTLASWDITSVTVTSSMFNGADEFTGIGLESWDFSNVTRANAMFMAASKLEADLKDWDLASITGGSGTSFGMEHMFHQGTNEWSKTQLENLLIQWELEAEDHANLRNTSIRITLSGHGFALSALSSDAQTAATELRDTHGWAFVGISGL
jgi:hypothetical protein